MSSRGHPTPPFNSPYQQHAMKTSSLLHSPAYPSPARSDSEPSRYAPDGLGLYNLSPQFPHTLPQPSSALFPPSPHPTESWPNISNGASPLMSEPIVDPWTSGAYDHPVSGSPIPWPQYQDSHRSSLSSQRGMSVFSGDGSETGFPRVKLENGSGWTTDDDAPPPGTVAPGRLLNSSLFPSYDQPYGSPMMPKYETTPGPSYEEHLHLPAPTHLESSHTGVSVGVTPRVRRRRTKTAPEDAKFTCEVCGRGFIRSYNKKSHMDRHKPNRVKLYKCDHGDCTMKFDRKTDLDRHNKSVHLQIRDYCCAKCGDTFSRKDTLRRHEEDGCQKKNQLSPSQLPRARYMRTTSDAVYQSPRPGAYAPPGFHPAEPTQGAFDNRSPPLYRHNFGASPHF